MFILYALIGMCAGFLGGLLGIGGGLITVPSLLFSFRLLDYPEDYAMKMAIGTSLSAMVFTAGSSALAHYLKRGIYWKLLFALAPGIAIGASSGAILADRLPSKGLELFFGCFECIVGLYFLFYNQSKEVKETTNGPHLLLFTAIGTAIGAFSSLLGIGGGIVTVPILTALGIPMRHAISTSAMTSFLIAFIGALSYLHLGMNKQTVEGSLGYLYLPAFILIAIFSSALTFYGAKLTYMLPVRALQRILGCILVIAGLSIILT